VCVFHLQLLWSTCSSTTSRSLCSCCTCWHWRWPSHLLHFKVQESFTDTLNKDGKLRTTKFKYYYFHNTDHGGSCGNKQDNISGDDVLPLMKLVQRSVMWTLGFGDAFFRTTEAIGFQEAHEEAADAIETAIV
jgi:hypothetical protein